MNQHEALAEKLSQLSQLLINSDHPFTFSSRLLSLVNSGQLPCDVLINYELLPTLISLVEQQPARDLLSKLKMYYDGQRNPVFSRLVTIAMDLRDSDSEAESKIGGCFSRSLRFLTILSTKHSKTLRQLCFPGLVLKMCWPDLVKQSISDKNSREFSPVTGQSSNLGTTHHEFENHESTNHDSKNKKSSISVLCSTYLLTFLANTCVNDLKTKTQVISAHQFTFVMLQILSKHSKKIQTTAYDNCDASISAQTSLTYAALYLLKNVTFGMHESVIHSVFDTNTQNIDNQTTLTFQNTTQNTRNAQNIKTNTFINAQLFSFIHQTSSSGNNKLAHTSIEILANITAYEFVSNFYINQGLTTTIFHSLPAKILSRHYKSGIYRTVFLKFHISTILV